MIRQRNTEPLRFRTEGEKKVFRVSQASDRQRVQTPRITPENLSMKFVAACKPFRWQLKEQSTIVWIGFLLVNQTWQGVGTKAFNWLSQLDRMIGELRGKSTHIGISAKNIPRNRLELHATACDCTAPCDVCHILPDLVVLIHNQRAQRCSMIIVCLQIYRHLNSTVAAVRYPHKYSRWHNKHCSIRWRVQLPLLREDWE